MPDQQPQANVSLRKVAAYRDDLTAEIVALLAPLGGMERFVSPGETVLLKPNLLGPFTPRCAVTTHPDVIAAVAALVQRQGAKVLIGDSPGCGSTEAVLKATGVGEVIERLGLEWVDMEQPAEFDFDRARVARHITLAAPLRRADKIINLAKGKTHVQMVFTGAMKNLYGYLPGATKSEYHYRLRTREWLAELQLDLNIVMPPVLHIIDMIDAHEGEGPSGGSPRRLGALIASDNSAAADTAAAALIGLKPEQVPLLMAARRRGFGETRLEKLVIHGDSVRSLAVNDFRHIRSLSSPLRLLPLPQGLLNYIQNHWKSVPQIDTKHCIKCLRCKNGCPVRPPAIDPERAATADRSRCIKCYCCHEFCPVKAISLPRTWLERFVFTPRLTALASKLAGVFKGH